MFAHNRPRRPHNSFAFYLIPVALAGLLTVAAKPQAPRDASRDQERLTKEVRHQLLLLPRYTVFDDLAYRIEGDKVTLEGAVTQPIKKSDAESAVKSIEGVREVDNKIKVLPLSQTDDQVRRAEFRAIYGFEGFDRYAIEANPPIHIIVENGHVTLTGVVANDQDKNLAGVRANSVPNVFSVQNNLQVEGNGNQDQKRSGN